MSEFPIRKPSLFLRLPHRHYGTLTLQVTLLASTLLMWTLPSGHPANRVINPVTFVVMVAGLLLHNSHARGLCTDCVKHMPPDASAQAERRLWMLRYVHWSAGRLGQAALPLFVVAAMIVAQFLTKDGVAYLSLFTVPMLWVVMQLGADRAHARFQPWCPLCRDGGGGEDEKSEAPIPSAPQMV